MEMSRLMRDGTAKPVSRDQIFRSERGQEQIHLPCLADDEQDWQPYSVDPFSCYMCDHTCTRVLTSSILWHQKVVLYPHPADAWVFISSASISQKRTHAVRVAGPFPSPRRDASTALHPYPRGLHTMFVFAGLLNAQRAAQTG